MLPAPVLFNATLSHGHSTMVDYNPGTNTIAAGSIVVVGNSLMIAHEDIPPNTLGALAVGGGVYDVVNGASGIAANAGNSVRWDTSGLVLTTNTNSAKLGECVIGGNTNNATLRVLHMSSENA